MEYYKIEPFGSNLYHTAQISQMLYNINRGKNSKALTAHDFIPVAPRPAETQEEKNEELKGQLIAFTVEHGGKIIQKGK